MTMHQLDLRGTGFLRQVDHRLLSERSVRYAGEMRQQRTGFGAIERLLVDGSLLPDPQPIGQSSTWIDENQWDFIVYAHTTAQAGLGGLTFATWKAARNKCGLFQGVPVGKGANALKETRRSDLVPRLTEFGFLEHVDPGPYQNETNSLKWKRLMLAPIWPPAMPVPMKTGIGKSIDSMREHGRSWFMMPSAIFNEGVWGKVGSHRGRRVIAALYAFYDAETYGAVNPNHVRIRGDIFEVSDSFLRACGEVATPRDVMSTIAWLVAKYRLFPAASQLGAGRLYPAGQEYVTWAQPVARNTPSDSVVFVPYYVPTEASQ